MNIDIPSMLFNLFGGLGIFLYGMRTMSEGLQKVAGDRLRDIFGMVTTNRFAGLFTGFLVTAIIQSSSATTVMLVGFVNAGLMSLQQAIHVILGANIGTTFTGWIIAFKITKYGLPIIAAGAGLLLFSKNPKVNYIGEVALGLGMLF
ncbi:MAG: Na/Pi symporter, partial [Desulfobacterales bacterium]